MELSHCVAYKVNLLTLSHSLTRFSLVVLVPLFRILPSPVLHNISAYSYPYIRLAVCMCANPFFASLESNTTLYSSRHPIYFHTNFRRQTETMIFNNIVYVLAIQRRKSFLDCIKPISTVIKFD